MVAEVNPKQAWKMLQDNPDTILLDVRDKVEFDYVGHPIDAVNIPIAGSTGLADRSGLCRKGHRTAWGSKQRSPRS